MKWRFSMLRNTKFFILFFAALLLSSCSGNTNQTPPTQDQNLGLSSKNSDEKDLITIQTSELGSEFLLQCSITGQRSFGTDISNPTSQSLRSRIVVFQKEGDEIVMLEANEGTYPGTELEAHALITTFPISKEDNSSVTFDLNKGMTNVVMSWDWFTSDDLSGDLRITNPVVLTIDSSYIREVNETSNSITIKQTISAKANNRLLPLEITYYLTPYKQNPDFVPVESPGFDYLGYFEANPIVRKDMGMPFTNITKWDISKPITYYLSTAIPEEYRDTFKEGVLYWNKVFGKDVLRVEMAPDGVTAPDFTHNIIQWHTDNNMYGYAYADAQVDPRTGEILHAQIYIPSMFANVFRTYTLPQYDRKLSTEKDDVSSTEISAQQIKESRLCTINIKDELRDIYKERPEILALSEDRIGSLTKNYLRRLVAHEVGHTLGLRHNFAASTVNEISGAEEEEILRDYIRTGVLPSDLKMIADSVMDYPSIEDKILIGAILGDPGSKPFSHDTYAIDWGYYDPDKKPIYEGLPFCSDSQGSTFTDCRPFDSGKHLIERSAYDLHEALSKIPYYVAENYLAAKATIDPSKRTTVDRATPYATSIARTVTGTWSDHIDFFTQSINILSIYHAYPEISDIDYSNVDQDMDAWLDYEIAYAGGIDAILKTIDPDEFTKVTNTFAENFENLIRSDIYKNIPLPEGGETSFTSDELDYMIKRSKELFPEVKERIASGITSKLAVSEFNQLDTIEKIEKKLAVWAEYIITAGEGPDFEYPISIRQEAVKILKSKGPFPDWLDSYVAPIAKKLESKLEERYGVPLEKLNKEMFKRDELQQVLNELSLYYSIAPRIHPIADEVTAK